MNDYREPDQDERLSGYFLEYKRYYDAGDIKNASIQAELYLKEEKERIPEDDPQMAYLHFMVGDTYFRQDLYVKAMRHFITAKEILEKNGKKDELEALLKAVNNALFYIFENTPVLGVLLERQGRHEEALEKFLHIIEVDERKDPGSEALSEAYSNAGAAYYQLRFYDKALECMQNAVNIIKKTASDCPSAAAIYNHMGVILSILGRHGDSLAFYLEALDILRKHYPADSHYIAITNINIGEMYRNAGQPKKAFKFYEAACRIIDKNPQNNHLAVYKVYGNIAAAYYDNGQITKSLKYLKRSLTQAKNAQPRDNNFIANLINHIAIIVD